MLKALGIATSKHDLLVKIQHSLYNFGRWVHLPFHTFFVYLLIFQRVHAGVPSTYKKNGPVLSEAAFMAAMKDYKDDDETEYEGKDVD